MVPKRIWAAVVLVGLVGWAGCATDESPVVEGSPDEQAAELATLEVTAHDDGQAGGYGFDVPASVEAGPTRISFENEGTEPHHAQLFRLNEGSTFDDLTDRLAVSEFAMFEVGSVEGGTGTTDPGTSAQAEGLVDLSEGTYVFLCFIPNRNGVPHVAEGMAQPFEVTGDGTDGALPEADLTATLADYAFGLPASADGDAVIELQNTSEGEIHEMNILAVDESSTTEDVAGFFSSEAPPDGPPPFSSVGGMQAITPGSSKKLQLDLEPGAYMVVCLIPSSDGVPHIAKGMIQPFTIE